MVPMLIEGVGEEVVWAIVVLLAIAVISLAWISTGMAPIEYYVWLVQMQIYPNRRVVQVLHVDNDDANIIENELVRRSIINNNNNNTSNSMSISSNSNSNSTNTNTTSNLNSNINNINNNGGGVSTRQEDTSMVLTSNEANALLDSSLLPSINTHTHNEHISTANNNGDNNRGALLLSTVAATSLQQIEQISASGIESNNVGTSATSARLPSTNTQHHHCSTTSAANGTNTNDHTSHHHMDAQQPSPSAHNDELSIANESINIIDQMNTTQNLSTIKLKFLDDTSLIANTTLSTTVGQFKRQYFMEPLMAGKVVRLIYKGQLLRDDSRSLLSYGIHDECVLHCNISSTPYNTNTSSLSTANANNNSINFNNNIGNNNNNNRNLLGSMTSAAIAAIAGAQATSTSTSVQHLIRHSNFYNDTSLANNDNNTTISNNNNNNSGSNGSNDRRILNRLRNAAFQTYRSVYNALLGPYGDSNSDVDNTNGSNDNVIVMNRSRVEEAADAAAAAALNEWNNGHDQSIIGGTLGNYLHLLFVVKFVMLWAFVFFYPQYTDRFSLLLLTFLSLFFATILFTTRRNDILDADSTLHTH